LRILAALSAGLALMAASVYEPEIEKWRHARQTALAG
jgi:hypothetical protein